MTEKRRSEIVEKTPLALPNLSEFASAPDFVQLTTNVVNGLSQVNSRLVSFAQASLQNNLAAVDQLRQVQSPQDLVEIQLQLARNAYDSYIAEATEIGQIVQQLSSDALASLTKSA